MQENKNTQPIDDERKLGIRGAMGCVAIIAIAVIGIGISLVIMYVRSILNGSKEFFIN